MLARPRNRHLRRGVGALVLVATLAGCTTSAAPDRTTAESRRITVARTPNLSDSTVAIATQAGWFEELGLDVVVVEGRGTTDVVPMLLSGEVDVVYGGFSSAIARALVEGSGARAVATVATTDPQDCDSYGFVLRRELRDRLDLSDPDELRTVRIAGPFESGFISPWMADRLADRAGLGRDDLDLRTVLPSDAAATLAGDGADLLLVGDPSLTRLREEMDVVMVASASDLVPGLALTGLYFGPRLLADPELAATYLAIHLRALRRHGEGPTAENVEALAASTGLDPELLSAMCWRTMTGETLPYVDAVESAFAFAQRQGLLDVAPAPEQLWDHSVRGRAITLLEEWGAPLDG